jgi:hypothetical protein
MFEPKKYLCDAPVIIENLDQAFDIAHLSLQKVEHAFQELGKQTKLLHPSSAVNFFLNNHVLPVNQDSVLQQQLQDAYTDEKWHHPIFNHPDLQHLAFALYSQGKITNPEFETLIRRFYLQPKVSPHVAKYGVPPNVQIHAYQLLDEDGNFTYEARKLILPIARTIRGDAFQGARLKNFQLLTQAFIEMYPKENVFFQMKSDQIGNDELLKLMFILNTVYSPDYLMESYLVFSCLIEDAFQLSSNTVDDLVYGRLLAGKLKKSHIERCSFHQIRPAAVMGFGLPETTEVHNYDPFFLTRYSIMAHDTILHAGICTTQGKSIGNLWNYLKALSRVPLQLCTNLKRHHFPLFSKLTWNLLDRDFLPQPRETLEDTFCRIMDSDRVFLFKQDELTDFGMQVLLDMVVNEQIWRTTLRFNPGNMNEKFKKYYDIALKISPFLEEDLQYNLIIFKAFLAFGETYFPIIRKFLASDYLRLQDSFEFIRNNSTEFLGLINKKLGKLDGNALAYVLLQSFEDFENIQQGIPMKTYKKFLMDDAQDKESIQHGKFIKNIVLLHLYFGNNPALTEPLSELRRNVLNITVFDHSMLDSVAMPLQQFLMFSKQPILDKNQQTAIREVIKYCFLLEKEITSSVSLGC